MPATTQRGTVIPYPSESPALPAALTQYDLSLVPQFVVGTEAEEIAARRAFVNEGGTGPGYFIRTDVQLVRICWNVEDFAFEPVEYLAGRQHGATVHLSAQVTGGAAPTPLRVTRWERLSTGFTLSPDGTGIVIPQTGFWIIGYETDIQGATVSTVGRTFAEIVVSGRAPIGRDSMTNDDRPAKAVPESLTKGDTVQLRFFHSASGTYTVNGRMHIIQTAGEGPNWTRA